MRVLPFFKPKKGWHVAGTNLETDSGGGSYVLPKASAETLGGVKVGNNLSIDANGVLSATGGVDPSMIAGTESTTTSTHAYEIGEYFISSTGLLCKATTAISIDDTISIGMSAGDNAVSVTVGGELSELNSNMTSVVDISSMSDFGQLANALKGHWAGEGAIGLNNPEGSNLRTLLQIDTKGTELLKESNYVSVSAIRTPNVINLYAVCLLHGADSVFRATIYSDDSSWYLSGWYSW